MKREFDCIDGPYNINDIERIGIISAEQWFKGVNQTILQIYIRPNDFVVGKWVEYDDGITAHAEGFVTIAICKERKDADILILNRMNKWNGNI
jgi:hypothetical protein